MGIADQPAAFCDAIARALSAEGQAQVRRAQPLLSRMSWDATAAGMRALLDDAIARRTRRASVTPAERLAAADVAGPAL